MNFKVNYAAISAVGTLVYRRKEYSLDTLNRKPGGITSVLLNDVQLDITDAGVVCAVWGMCPHTVWQEESIPLPKYKQGALIYEGEIVPGVSVRVNPENRWPIRYDPQTGWVALSCGQVPALLDAVEFLPRCLAAVKEGTLVCVWMKPKQL